MNDNTANSNNIHYVDIHVGRKLKEKRLERGITQDDLAGSVNLTFQQVQKYEKGINRISSSKLYDFAKFLDIDVSYFFQGLDDYKIHNQEQLYASDKVANDFGATVKNREIESLVQAFKCVSNAEVRKNIISLVKTLTT
ncbi:helix-turn-helix domain-containing protein [Candidatus Bandiella euplotis]|uniref:Helix-turn-helix domain transcriptional regulator n=1 Tax=Candidatus Bandiella euplotis TaxID=1664265 RepID=A0ABZ0UJX7_9RICK|nr:helix-turn-helix transcriptional regulator [Candidatus Bandiella woodruffii]WPX96414.1 Helix-turn-helix domain transcriptional regulator [Candidatus Bandiella woodruffii]